MNSYFNLLIIRKSLPLMLLASLCLFVCGQSLAAVQQVNPQQPNDILLTNLKEGNININAALNQGFNIDHREQGARGDTLLHCVLAKKDISFARYILANCNADPNVRNGWGMSPLVYAMRTEVRHLVTLLLNNGANPNQQDDDGNGPLHAAAYCHQSDFFNLLLQANADLELQNSDGYTPLHFAAYRPGFTHMFEHILNHGANINVHNTAGSTILHTAAANIKSSAVEITLNHPNFNLGVDCLDAQGRTPLHIAAGNNNSKACRLLINAGANLNARDNYGNTPLHYASKILSVECMKILKDAGANVCVTNNNRNVWHCHNDVRLIECVMGLLIG